MATSDVDDGEEAIWELSAHTKVLTLIGTNAMDMMIAQQGVGQWAHRRALCRLLFSRGLESDVRNLIARAIGIKPSTLWAYCQKDSEASVSAFLGVARVAETRSTIRQPAHYAQAAKWVVETCNATRSGDRAVRLVRYVSKQHLFELYKEEGAPGGLGRDAFRRLLADVHVRRGKHDAADHFSCVYCRTVKHERKFLLLQLAEGRTGMSNKIMQRLDL